MSKFIEPKDMVSTEFIANVISTYPPYDKEHPENCLPIAENIVNIPLIYKAPEMFELLKTIAEQLRVEILSRYHTDEELQSLNQYDDLIKEIEGE